MAGAGTLSRSDFPKLYAQRLAYIKKLIGMNDWPEHEQDWMSFFNIDSSNRLREEFQYYAGFGRFVEMGENDAVTYDKILQGPTKSVSHTLWGLGYQIGYRAAKDDLDGIIRRNAPALGYSLRQSILALAWDFYNGLGDTYTTADGQFVVSGSHTYVRGSGTFSNLSSSTMGQSALEAGWVAFRKQKDLMQNPQPIPVQTLLVAPDLRPLTDEIITSTKRHDTATHANNFLNQRFTVRDSPWITDTTQWLLLGPKNTLKIFWLWNIRPETSHGFDFDREAAKTKTLFCSSVVGVDPRGVYGKVAT